MKRKWTLMIPVENRWQEKTVNRAMLMFASTSLHWKWTSTRTAVNATNYIIKEDLALLRLDTVKEAWTKYGFKNVCSMNGIIIAKTEQGVMKISNNWSIGHFIFCVKTLTLLTLFKVTRQQYILSTLVLVYIFFHIFFSVRIFNLRCLKILKMCIY